jgi:hypothetical protein
MIESVSKPKRRIVAAASMALACLGAGCGGSSEVASNSGPREEVPGSQGFTIGPLPAVAPLDDGFAIAEAVSADGTRVAFSSIDGTMKSLPEAPPLRSRVMVPASDTVLILGIACAAESCEQAALSAWVLDREAERWVEQDVPEVAVFPDSDIEVVGGGSEGFVVVVGGNEMVVRPDGAMSLLPSSESSGALSCATTSTGEVYRLTLDLGGSQSGPAQPNQAIQGSVIRTPKMLERASLADLGAGWSRAAIPSLTSDGAPFNMLCTADSLLVVAASQEQEFRDGSWSAPSEVTIPGANPQSRLLQSATAVDETGALVSALVDEATVVRRTTDGEWEATEAKGTAVFASEAGGIVVVEPSGESLKQLPA